MTVRRILIFVPILLILFLLHSYLWVPTYEQQTRGNPDRLIEYITGSIGDASILNPILAADSASGSINDMVFEGLIDRDEDLHFRGRLATSWEIYEEAFFYVNQKAHIPGIGRANADEVVSLLKEARAQDFSDNPELNASLDNIGEISIIPAREFSVTRHEKTTKEEKEKIEVKIRVMAPARIKLVLRKVDQDLFTNLSSILGDDYFRSFPAENYVSIQQRDNPQSKILNQKSILVQYAKDILPATEHNPIVIFHLRPNVKFHDGHILDANDVKFTYEAIMNPKNLSPRDSDYEPDEVDTLIRISKELRGARLYREVGGSESKVVSAHRLHLDVYDWYGQTYIGRWTLDPGSFKGETMTREDLDEMIVATSNSTVLKFIKSMPER